MSNLWDYPAAGDMLRFREGPRLNNPEPMVQAGFGMSIAVDGKRILVGAPHAGSRKGETGKAYVFDAHSGRLLQTFLPPSPVGEDLFGLSVGMVADLIVVGSPQGRSQEGTRNGVVHLFQSDTGALVRTLHNPSSTGEIFGHAVAGHGEWLIIGDPGASVGRQFHVGAAYLFNAKTGRLIQEYLSPDSQLGEVDRFGHAVGFVGSLVVVAAPLGGKSPADQGVVYLFDRSSGKLRHRLLSPQPQTQEYFGWGIAGDEHGLLIGAGGSRQGNLNGGASYLFTPQGVYQRTFVSPVPTNGERFGEAVGLMSHYAIVAAPGRITSGFETGGIFVFDRAEGGFQFSIENPASPGGIEDAFGLFVIGSNDTLAVGSPFGGRGQALDAGVVHQFRVPRPY